MWKQIQKKQSFQNKRVIDIGCGPASFMLLALESGAEFVLGVERDFTIAYLATQALSEKGYNHPSRCEIWASKIEDAIGDDWEEHFDIAMCFSALPYFDYPEQVLTWMHNNAEVSLIECQYSDDGPGLKTLSDDGDMKDWLRYVGWKSVKKIGETDVVIRPAKRSIWRCTHG